MRVVKSPMREIPSGDAGRAGQNTAGGRCAASGRMACKAEAQDGPSNGSVAGRERFFTGGSMLVGTTARRVAILGGARIPFARAHTTYATVDNQEMLTAVFRAVVDRFGLTGVRLGDVTAGAVIKHSRDYNLTRESVLSS